MTIVVPSAAAASSAALTASLPERTVAVFTSPTGSRVCCASQRRMSESVIGVSGWCRMLDSLSSRSWTKRWP
ncbi:hypothetical protein D3C71_2052050 [compost metagenome]